MTNETQMGKIEKISVDGGFISKGDFEIRWSFDNDRKHSMLINPKATEQEVAELLILRGRTILSDLHARGVI